MNCQYCRNTFKTAYTLKTHQTKAKYCLKLQGKENSNSEFKCGFCHTSFTRKFVLKNHYEVCKANNKHTRNAMTELEKAKIVIVTLKKRVEELENDKRELREDYANLAAISAKRSTITNNTTNNLNLGVFDKSQADIKRIVDENYDRTYLIQGQRGVARFTHKHVLNKDPSEPPIYVITDRSRGNGKYKISDTEVVTDIGMFGLTKKVYPSIKRKAVFITSSEANPMDDDELMAGYHEVFEMDQDNAVFRTHLTEIIKPNTPSFLKL